MTEVSPYDAEVIVVGGGPVGIELAIALQRAGASTLLIEAKQIGHAFSEWPAATHFFSSPEHVALAGVPVHNLDQMAVTGEQYLAYLRTLVEMFDLNLRLYEPVTGIEKSEGGFEVRTEPLAGARSFRCRNVVLCTGGLARPRMLHIPGEDMPHVSHYFHGPHAYFRRRLLIVGGRNSAAEAALRCWRAGAQVSLSYRGAELNFERIKPHLSIDLSDRLSNREIEFLPSTTPVRIGANYVDLASTAEDRPANGKLQRQEADAVLLCTGFEADMSLFREAGVRLQGTAQAPVFDENSMETNVPGLYVAGTAAGGTQERFVYFISTSHDHVARVVVAITGKSPGPLGSVPARNNAVTWDQVKAN